MAGQLLSELEEQKNAGLTADVKKKLKKANDGLKQSKKNLEESIKQCGIKPKKKDRCWSTADLEYRTGRSDVKNGDNDDESSRRAGRSGLVCPRDGCPVGQWVEGGAGPFLGWEEHLHLPHGWIGSISTWWKEWWGLPRGWRAMDIGWGRSRTYHWDG